MAEGILVERIVLDGLVHSRCSVTVALSSLAVEGTLLKSIVRNRLVHSLVAIALAILPRAESSVPHLRGPLSVLFFVKRHFEREDLGQWKKKSKSRCSRDAGTMCCRSKSEVKAGGRKKVHDRGKI